MPTVAKTSGPETQFKPAPPGNHLAICVAVYDLGTQETTYQGKVSWKPQVKLQWELCDEPMEDGRPFTLTRNFTLSLHENSHLRPFLQAWRGRPFTEKELQGFDIKNLLGVPCMLTVTHQPARDGSGKTFVQVDAAAPLPKRVGAPDPVNPLRYYSTEMGPPGDDVPERIREKILKAREFDGTRLEDIPPAGPIPDESGDDEDSPPF